MPRTKIEIVVEKSRTDGVLDRIASSARTGKTGDGKIFTIPPENAIRIRTGEQGS